MQQLLSMEYVVLWYEFNMDLQTLFTQRLFKHRHTDQFLSFIQKSILRVGFLAFSSPSSLTLFHSHKDWQTHAHTHLSEVPVGMVQEAMKPNRSQAWKVNMVQGFPKQTGFIQLLNSNIFQALSRYLKPNISRLLNHQHILTVTINAFLKSKFTDSFKPTAINVE